MFLLTTMGNHAVKEGFQDVKSEIKRAQSEKDMFIYLTNEDGSKCILQLNALCLAIKPPEQKHEKAAELSPSAKIIRPPGMFNTTPRKN